jgi:hypothetical protein
MQLLYTIEEKAGSNFLCRVVWPGRPLVPQFRRMAHEGQSSSTRPRQGLGNVPIGAELPPEKSVDEFRAEDVVCRETLGALLKHYQRRAA